MQDKITLEELAPYLPYDLKLKSSMDTIYKMGLYNDMKGSGIETRTIDQCLDMKPLVRPFSQLTQEIEHNGQRFVPIVELAKISSPFETADCDHEFFECNYPHCIEMGCNLLKGGVVFWSISFDWQQISFWTEMELETFKNGFIPQYKLIRKLHEWHFDLNNWIERGLALPIED